MAWKRFAPRVTKAEQRLFHALNKANIKFFSQEYIHTKHRDYLVDFLIFPNLVVEVDGASHKQELRQAKDLLKDEHLHEIGYTVLRFQDIEIHKNINTVIKQIREALKWQSKKSAPTADKPNR